MQTNDRPLTDLMKAVAEGKAQLPDFQRGWVWDDNRIKALILSVIHNYPVGAAMFLSYGNESIHFKHKPIEGSPDQNKDVAPDELILDGQQRLTSLYNALYYLSDSGSQNVFLSEDENGSYLKALSKFVKAPQDDDTMYQIEALYNDNIRDICEQYIYPRWGNDPVTDNDVKEAYGVKDKCAFIKVLSYFRHKSFDNVMGNASKNSEAEIIQDYKNDPWKFVYEFIQNVDDCAYEEDVAPSLSITIGRKRIIFDYNEKGFTADDIIALTRYGDSKKSNSYDKNVKQDGIFDQERTGKLGRGFKSVFALPGDNIVVHIQSNGYSFFFHKRIGAIVPIWEESAEPVTNRTKITIEGLPSDILADVFDKLVGILSIGKPDELFAKCPVLYLRKLADITAEADIKEQAQKIAGGNEIKINSRIQALRNLSQMRIEKYTSEARNADKDQAERFKKAIVRDRDKTEKKVADLEKRKNFGFTTAFQSILILDVY